MQNGIFALSLQKNEGNMPLPTPPQRGRVSRLMVPVNFSVENGMRVENLKTYNAARGVPTRGTRRFPRCARLPVAFPYKTVLFMQKRLFCLFIVLLASTPVVYGQARGEGRLKVGLVLGGGGAKGAAHVGVLRAIEEAGIPIDYVAGTSIGAIVGGLYCCGYRADDIEKMFLGQQWSTLLSDRNDNEKKKAIRKVDGVTYVFGYPVSGRRGRGEKRSVGLLRGEAVVELLDSMTGRRDSISFDALPIPFRCVAFDVRSQSEVVLSSGRLPVAMRASMSIPGAFKPVWIDEWRLVDGGMINNLPVDVARAMGADIVIAIDLTQNKHKSRNFSLKETLGIGGGLNWLVSRPDWKRYNDNREAADVYINPQLDFSATDFKEERIREMIKVGTEEGNLWLDRLKELKKSLTPNPFF